MASKDGGSAAPEVFSTFDAQRGTLTDVYSAGGMSLLDCFAAAVLQGQMSIPDDASYRASDKQTLDEWRASQRDITANYCYEMAASMLKARPK